MRVVLATVGSLGDLHPYIAIARALKARGARPVLASVPEYREHVEREGIEFAPVGPGFAAFGDYRKLMEKIFQVPQGVEFIVREMVMPHLRTAYEGLLRATEGADFLPAGVGALLGDLPAAARRRRAVGGTAARVSTRARTAALPRDRHARRPVLAIPQPGALRPDARGAAAGLATQSASDRCAYARRSDPAGLLGRGRAAARIRARLLGGLDRGRLLAAGDPYSHVFPRALAVIHQCGIGTLAQALRSGHPKLVAPFAFDQPDNARRAAALGLARVLPARRITTDRLIAEPRALLADGAYDKRAQAVARELAATNGAARAADELMRIAAC